MKRQWRNRISQAAMCEFEVLMCFGSYVKGWNKTMQPRMGIGNNINETEKRGCFFIQCSSPALSGLGLSLAPLMFQPRHQNVIAEVTFLSSTIILQ